GVNDYFANHRDSLHSLFAKLNLQPEPWTPADCIASWWQLAQFFAGDGTQKLVNYRELAKAPATPLKLVFDDSAAVVGERDVSRDWIDRVQRFHRENGTTPVVPEATRPDGPHFSHAWVVGGKKTTTGAAVLVSDP